MNRGRTRAVGLICCWLAAASIASGQTTSGTILGEIRDSTGGALPGVTVIAVNQANGAKREVVTDALGLYRFSALPPGQYTLTASLGGFREVARADVRL